MKKRCIQLQPVYSFSHRTKTSVETGIAAEARIRNS